VNGTDFVAVQIPKISRIHAAFLARPRAGQSLVAAAKFERLGMDGGTCACVSQLSVAMPPFPTVAGAPLNGRTIDRTGAPADP